MRLLLREHGIFGGIETVNVHLVREFTQLVDRIVWVMPSWRFEFYQRLFPPSNQLIYVSHAWPRQAWIYHNLERATNLALRQKNLPARFAFEKLQRALSNLRLRRLIREHKITHCFCNWTLRVQAPRLSVPMGTMVMDVRWRHFPETFPDDVDVLDRQFRSWLKRSRVIFPISEATAIDVKRFYPWFSGATRVVPHGARTNHAHGQPRTPIVLSRSRPVFYCPAIVHPHKDHLTLFEACAKLLAKGYDFEVALTGFLTEGLSNGCPNPEATVALCRAFLRKRANLFGDRIKALGYCDSAEVQAIYQGCTAVVLPSFFEGFGLTLTEALQNGATVIC